MLVLRLRHGLPAGVLGEIKIMAERFPGEQRLTLQVVGKRGGIRTLEVGRRWSYDGSPQCLAALAEFGDLQVESPATWPPA